MNPRSPENTTARLLAAGAELADSEGLATLTVDAIVAKAGTGKGTFYRHFTTQENYLVELHTMFVSGLTMEVGKAIGPLQPGPERLEALTIGYLEACLGRQGLKAFLTEARVMPAVADAVDAALGRFAGLVADDYTAMGDENPGASARLFVAMAHEVALAERRAQHRVQTLRESLLRMGTPDRGAGSS